MVDQPADNLAHVLEDSYSLLAPGPVNLHPEVRRLMALPMIHHRTPEFDKILARVLEGLKAVFATKQRVFMHTSTGSGGMESLLVNTLSPGDKVIAVVSGKFGERWAQIAETYGAQVIPLNVEWGHAVKPAALEELLNKHPATRLVLTQACETSSAVLHPIRELAALVKPRPRTLLLVDGITAVGALPLPMDEWGIDGLVAGSQKAFMLPTGLSFVSLSEKAWKVAETATTPRFYFDLRKERRANESGETLFSSPVPLIRALDWVLSDVAARGGWSALYRIIERRAAMTREFARLAGLELYSRAPSASLTALTMPEGVDGQKVRARLEAQFQITVMGGQDQAKGKIIRIGHMGHVTDAEMMRLFDRLGRVMQEFRPAEWTDAKIATVAGALRTWTETHREG